MRLLVTGGTGFLGTQVVAGLAAQGHEVRVLGRSRPAGSPGAGVRHVQADLGDREAVRGALEGVEVLYHLAGLVSFKPQDGRRMFELHVERTRELLRQAREAGVRRVVLASTSGTIAVAKDARVASEADDYPLTVVGRWPYYLSKIYEEKLALEYCRRHGIALVVLNPSLLMGPGDERLSSTWAVVKFLQGDVPAMPRGGLSFVDVRDAAAAFVQALTRGEVYGRHLMGVNMTNAEFFGRLERLTGVAAPRLRLPSQVNVLGARLLNRWAKVTGATPRLDVHEVEMGEHFFYLDSAKAQRELGFRARDPQETLHDTVQHLLSRMPPGRLPGVKGRLAELRRGT